MILVFFACLIFAAVAWALGCLLLLVLVPTAVLIGLPFGICLYCARGLWRVLHEEPRPLPRMPPPPAPAPRR